MPVVIWGNGGCSSNALSHHNFLIQVASHGFIAIASGTPNGRASTTAQMMTDAIDWAVEHAGKGDWAAMDAGRIAVAGMSCGGIEAYDNALDERVAAVGIFNSGQLQPALTQSLVAKITKPVFFFLGGESDIAYANVSTVALFVCLKRRVRRCSHTNRV
jgi:dienelactone hydrolase